MERTTMDAILLAAGASARFGSDKRLLKIDGVPMLQRSLAALLPAARQVLVVLREGDQRRLDALLGPWQDYPAVLCLFLEAPNEGMGANLARAVTGLQPDCDGVLVALGDMPFLRAESVKAVIDAFKADTVVAPVHAGQRGHPVLFPRVCFPLLAELSGDRGARLGLGNHAIDWIGVPVDDPGVLKDIDMPQDGVEHAVDDQQAH